MKQGIAFVIMRSRRIWVNWMSFFIDIASIEEFVVRVPHLASVGEVALYIVELADTRGKVDVLSVSEFCITEDEEAVLWRK